MAAFHFSAKIVSRSSGRSSVGAAAYRAGERLVDERTGVTVDYTGKTDIIESAIFAPAGAPDWVFDRSTLWNRVEARENRKDAQLAQEFELNLPREFSDAENWRLVTDFVRQQLVANGRVVDVNFHCPIKEDGRLHPHAHILMPMRVIDSDRLGDKHPDVDRKTFFQNSKRIEQLREAWCEFGRQRAAELGIDLGPNWDHRSYEARGLEIEAQPKIGAASARMDKQKLGPDRTAQYEATIERNGERFLADPSLVLAAMTAQSSTFTEADLARWLHRYTDDDRFSAILVKAKALAVYVGKDERGKERFSTAEMVEVERQMLDDAADLAARPGHMASKFTIDRHLMRSRLSSEQKAAARHILSGGDLSALVGLAGAGKSTMLLEVRSILEQAGYNVMGAALSGIAAENLEVGSGIKSRTLHSLAYGWERQRDRLTDRDVLVIDEAGMIGSRQLAGVLAEARSAGAKVILVGDHRQLQAIDAGSSFKAMVDRFGAAELSTVRRQQVDWQREATAELAAGRIPEAIGRYVGDGAVIDEATSVEARSAIVRQWLADRSDAPQKSQIILAHTRAGAQAINNEARQRLAERGELQGERDYDTNRGRRAFAVGDLFLFLKNDRDMAVKNGTLGRVTEVGRGKISVVTDDGRTIAVDPSSYKDFDHGYALTVHKAQGLTVDRALVLASRGFDSHLTYVALSRHREAATLFYARDEFADEAELVARLRRDRTKDTTLEYSVEAAVEFEHILPARQPRLSMKERREQLAEVAALNEAERSVADLRARMRTDRQGRAHDERDDFAR